MVKSFPVHQYCWINLIPDWEIKKKHRKIVVLTIRDWRTQDYLHPYQQRGLKMNLKKPQIHVKTQIKQRKQIKKKKKEQTKGK